MVREHTVCVRKCTCILSVNDSTLTFADFRSLHDIQKELNGIADEQHWTCNDIIALVNENESILQQMKVRLYKVAYELIAPAMFSKSSLFTLGVKDYLREVVMADITRLVLRSDKRMVT